MGEPKLGDTFKTRRVLKGSRAPFAFTKDSRRLLTTRKDSGLDVWDAASGALLGIISSTPPHSRLVDATNDKFALIAGSILYVCELERGLVLSDHNFHSKITSARFSNSCNYIVVTLEDGTVHRCGVKQNGRLSLLERHSGTLFREVALNARWSRDDSNIAIASYNTHILDVRNNSFVTCDTSIGVYDAAISDAGPTIMAASATASSIIEIWDIAKPSHLISLEGHESEVLHISFLDNDQFLLSSSRANMIVWRCSDWHSIAHIPIALESPFAASPNGRQIAFFPRRAKQIHLCTLADDVDFSESSVDLDTIVYKTAKVVLVGDSGVGKTGLGWRLAHGDFKDHPSTHGQQFWVLDSLSQGSPDEQQEAVLWDLAGQPDYRLIHALFVDDADVALILCDPTHPDNPLRGVEYWLKQLRIAHEGSGESGPRSALVAARCDRGTARVTVEEMREYCKSKNVGGYFCTSAFTGEGLPELLSWMQGAISWSTKPATVTTTTFKYIKDFVLSLKENRSPGFKALVTLDDLRAQIGGSAEIEVSKDQVRTAVGHLSNHGFVAILKTSTAELRVLLVPELLNNLAASFVLEARRNVKGLGALSERDLLKGGYEFPESRLLSASDRETMIDATITRFLEHNICLRETDPLNKHSYLVFPELINLRAPSDTKSLSFVDDASYSVSGSLENVYASLVVLLGYTNTFTRATHWKNNAQYEVGDGMICGFRMEELAGSDTDFVIYFGDGVPENIKGLFRSLFESFLLRHDVSVRRYPSASCSNGHTINRYVVRDHIDARMTNVFCSRCGQNVDLTVVSQMVQIGGNFDTGVGDEKRRADRRSKLERALFRSSTYIAENGITPPVCFLSYAWGDSEQERWVERFAHDLSKAGFDVLLDKWHNSRVGASVSRFVEQAAAADCILVIGTEKYRVKYKNQGSRGFIVSAEGDIISTKMLGTENDKSNVLPILLDGTEKTSFPELLWGRVYSDFRSEDEYFSQLVRLVISILKLDPRKRVAQELLQFVEGAFIT